MAENDPLLNKYSLVKGAARRARQLQSGAPSLGVSKSLKACRVAQDEVRAGKVQLQFSRRPQQHARFRLAAVAFETISVQAFGGMVRAVVIAVHMGVEFPEQCVEAGVGLGNARLGGMRRLL